MKNGSYSSLMTSLAMAGRKQTHSTGNEQTKTFSWSERVYRPALRRRGGTK